MSNPPGSLDDRYSDRVRELTLLHNQVALTERDLRDARSARDDAQRLAVMYAVANDKLKRQLAETQDALRNPEQDANGLAHRTGERDAQVVLPRLRGEREDLRTALVSLPGNAGSLSQAHAPAARAAVQLPAPLSKASKLSEASKIVVTAPQSTGVKSLNEDEQNGRGRRPDPAKKDQAKYHPRAAGEKTTPGKGRKARRDEDDSDARTIDVDASEDSEVDKQPPAKRQRFSNIARASSTYSQVSLNDDDASSESDALVNSYRQEKTAQAPLASGPSDVDLNLESTPDVDQPSYGSDIEASQPFSIDETPPAPSTSTMTPNVKSIHRKFWATHIPRPSLIFNVIQIQYRVSSKISSDGLCKVRSTNVASVSSSTVLGPEEKYIWETWRRVPSAYRRHLARACWRLWAWSAAWEAHKDAEGYAQKIAVGRTVKRHVVFIGKVLDAVWEELRLAAEGDTLGAECRSPTLDHYLRIEGLVDGFTPKALEKYLEELDEASLDWVDPLHLDWDGYLGRHAELASGRAINWKWWTLPRGRRLVVGRQTIEWFKTLDMSE
ncbi:hypothetical protein FA95DRAFT_1610744 [Auriscalpium vulgare]|uniref:Uncharacterized protein n=1 Tax=Auriscalpium vulgare TaxID=40419 RepID=A0ACB8RD20_9AGAM|nr:hypothetical protein FA95DRAFT_1610744 [Auriscalpium vulgare]